MAKGQIIYEFFEPEIIALQAELSNGMHHELCENLGEQTAGKDSPDLALSIVAAHCGVVMNGSYSYEDRVKLCGILAGRLVEKRILPGAQNILQLPSSTH